MVRNILAAVLALVFLGSSVMPVSAFSSPRIHVPAYSNGTPPSGTLILEFELDPRNFPERRASEPDETQELSEGFPWFVFCSTLQVAAQFYTGFPFGALFCSAVWEATVIDDFFYGPLYSAVHNVLETMLPGWVYEGYHHYEYVQVSASIWGGGGASGIDASVTGVHDSQVCGMYGCMCDEDAPCFDGSVCVYEGAWGTCKYPLAED